MRPSKKPWISKKNVKARLEFARAHKDWSVGDWGRVLWSDESKFNLFSSDGIRYVRRPLGQRNNPKYQIPTFKHGGGSVMTWGKHEFFSINLCTFKARFLVMELDRSFELKVL